MKVPAILLCLLFCVRPGLAQKHFLAAQLCTQGGDTMMGFVQAFGERNNPGQIVFSNNSAGHEPVTYKASAVKWFWFTHGDLYFGYTGPMETSLLNEEQLTYDSTLHTRLDTLFIRAVLLSRASLFYARDRNDRVHLFIQKDSSDITELILKRYFRDETVLENYRNAITRRAVISNELYKGQLMAAFADCKSVQSRILTMNLDYTEKSMRGLFESYNQCHGQKVTYVQEIANGRLDLQVLGGLHSKGVQVSSSLNSLVPVTIDRGIGYQGGLGLNWILPRTNLQWSVYNELIVEYTKLDGVLSQLLKPEEPFVFTSASARLFTAAQYRAALGTVKPFAGLGITNSLNLYNEVDNEKVAENIIFSSYRKYEQGIAFDAGLTWNNLLVDLRMEFSNGWSALSGLKTGVATYYLQLGYIF